MQTKTKTTAAPAAPAAPKPAYRPLTAKRFARLSPATQRVKIAEDVLAVIAVKKNRYTVGKGYYCHTINTPDLSTISESDQLRKVLPKLQKNCEVCAMGALFLSHVRINNEITVGEANSHILSDGSFGIGDWTMEDKMAEYFSPDQLREVETAFEGFSISGQPWLHKYPENIARLRAICRNIIRNKGDFDITQVR